MEEKITKEMQEKLEEKIKLPKEIKEKQNKIAMENFFYAIFMSVYFIFLNMGFHNIVKHIFVVDTQVFSGVALVTAIILFEKAFKKENGNIAIHGIEILVLAIITLFIPFIYYMNMDFTGLIMVILIAGFNLYYLTKVVVISLKIQSEYRASLSDVKKIIKKEKKKVEEVTEEELEKVPTKNEKQKRTRNAKTKDNVEEKTTKTKTTAKKKTDTETTKTSTKTKQKKQSDKPAKKTAEKKTEEKPKTTTKTTTKKRTTKKKEEEK